MSLILSGTDGLSDVDGSASTPAIRGTDTNTGIFFPAADTIAFAEGGAEVARFDSSGNLGIGTSSPTNTLDVSNTSATNKSFRIGQSGGSGTANATAIISNGGTGDAMLRFDYEGTNTDRARIGVTASNQALQFFTAGNNERMRIDSSGNVIFGATALTSPTLYFTDTADGGFFVKNANTTSATTAFDFLINGTRVGSITTSGSNTTYSTSSDYRLKENIAPMTGALAKVSALKPCTYTWKSTGEQGEGFIAHELQEVVPECVVGEKDAVDEEGNPQYQGIDTSFLVATLTAAIQELKAELDSVKAELVTLKAK
jgi:hypothetical protein